MAGACVRFRFASDRPAAGLIYFARQSACSTPALTDLIAGSIDVMFVQRLHRQQFAEELAVAVLVRHCTTPRAGKRPTMRPCEDQGLVAAICAAICDSPAIRKDHVMSKRENDANNIFRPSDSRLTEYEKEQIALRKNFERLKAERLAREAANSKNE